MIKRFLLTAALYAAAAPGFAQDFGFGFDNEDGGGNSFSQSAVSVGIDGEVSASLLGYGEDFAGGAASVRFGDIFTGRLNFSVSSSNADGIIKLKLRPGANPVSVSDVIDEGFLRLYFGNVDVEAGLHKLTWGKADSFGPLDVINPLDSEAIFTEMADNTDLTGVKIARPMLHLSARLGQFSKLEGVFVPGFEPYRIAKTGRWAPAQLKMLSDPPLPYPISMNVETPDTSTLETLEYAQTGARFTTTLGSSDLGFQYYYGRLPQPAVSIQVDMPRITAEFLYNRYHQVGVDYAQVIYGFNTRAEFAANITEDADGTDRAVYNPSLAWSLGFDRDLFAGVNLNLQVNETIRLGQDGLGSAGFADVLTGGFDIEGGKDLTATRVTAALSRKFLRDELEARAALVWDIEDSDCLVMPALIWTRGDVKLSCSGGIFGGEEDGQLGQYRGNNFLKLGVSYTF
ncbi:MAG: hypothetical protein LBF83_08615 [Spirochaetaceae bacterium]|jgi:hypothetical protein|nr:hypothetical protein [Spirochaetaceae bacterium]